MYFQSEASFGNLAPDFGSIKVESKSKDNIFLFGLLTK
jgi:hypothetical protein